MGAEEASEVRALLALWNDVDPIHDVAYNDWHANEHVPERLTVPGMLFGLRFRTLTGVPGPRYLTLYGLRDVQVLDSAAYQHLLAWPTPMSARMRPVMHNISRAVYDVQVLQGRLDLPCLSVSEGEHEPPMLPQAPGCLQGLRRADTQPLPWVRVGQTAADPAEQARGFLPPAHLWLIAREQAQPSADGALDYRRLPVADARSTG